MQKKPTELRVDFNSSLPSASKLRNSQDYSIYFLENKITQIEQIKLMRYFTWRQLQSTFLEAKWKEGLSVNEQQGGHYGVKKTVPYK